MSSDYRGTAILKNCMADGWKFYGRAEALGALLERLRANRWFLGSVRGRRRIGKVALIKQALQTLADDDPDGRRTLYIQLSDSSVADAVAVFRMAIQQSDLEDTVGGVDKIANLPGIAAAVGALNREGVVVVFDDFQACFRGPLRGLPSLLQAQVDTLIGSDRGGLILLGSGQAEMEALLASRQAPLFGRRAFSINLDPWTVGTVFEVCADQGATDPERCLTLWTLFGGIPHYWRLFSEGKAVLANIQTWADWSKGLCETLFFRPDSSLRDEGEILLGRELHRANLTVLRAIAERMTCSRADLRTALPDFRGLDAGLACLVNDLRLVTKELPVFAHGSSGKARYSIADSFLGAWLAGVQPACRAERLGDVEQAIRGVLIPRIQTLEGFAFARMVREAMVEASRLEAGDFPLSDFVRGYWNRPRNGSEPIEIDVVAWNDDRERIRFGSCKRRAEKHDRNSIHEFRSHVRRFLETAQGRRYRGWQHEYALYAPSFPAETRKRLESQDYLCQDLDDFKAMLTQKDCGPKGAL